MLESVEITLASGMDRDTSVPPIHLRAASWRICLQSALALGLMGPLGNAQALGLGRPLAQSVLGQPLVLTFPLSLRAGESLAMDCVFAEVIAGGVKLPASKIGVRLEGESESNLRAIRVLSSVSIEEPILNVTLSLGCPVRLTRQFSALMDPPSKQDGASPEAHSSGESPRLLSPALRAALATADARPKELLGENLSAAMGQERLTASTAARAAPAGALKKEGKANSQDSVALAGKSRNSTLEADAPNTAHSKPNKTTKVASAAKGSLPVVAEPQLRLEAFDINSAAANSSAAAASAAEASMARLQQVESGLLGLQTEYRSNASKLSAMQQGLEAGAGPAATSSNALPGGGLGALAVLLGAAVAYLWRSRSRPQLGGDSNWWGQEVGQAAGKRAELGAKLSIAAQTEVQEKAWVPQGGIDSTGADMVASLPTIAAPDEHTIALPHSVTAGLSAIPNTMPLDLPDKAVLGLERISQLMANDLNLEPLSVQFIDPFDSIAAAFVGVGSAASTDQHLVSVEELIDLEQQVDFFLVLGQDEAAVDLLHGQLKPGASGACSSALPYLKLMEICQQRGDALAFADIAGRYVLEFNASPPAWDVNLEFGQGLEAYPDVVQSLQSRWSDSGASMAGLQKLLSSRDGRSASFDLPALRDLLLLYSVARDRSEHEVRGEEIDLFLPLEPNLELNTAAGHPTGFDLMATMVWQGKSGADTGVASAPLDVDILLDDASAPAQTSWLKHALSKAASSQRL